MKIDKRLEVEDISTITSIRDQALRAEELGYAGLWSSETAHDPFLPLMIAAEHTKHIGLGCAIAVAFSRNPMTVANLTHDLQRYTGGRFTLGLGTQVKSHIERRFSMPWSDPAKRLAEFVAAVRSILGSWESGEQLGFEGKYYRHTLMTPMFTPEPHGYGTPRIILGGVGRGMIETAGQVADGLVLHALSSPSYMQNEVAPAVARGLAERGLAMSDFEISFRVMLATGRDQDEIDRAKEAVRGRIAFYGSTLAYRPVLEHHGWGDLGERLYILSRAGEADRWTRMARLVDDEVLETFAVVAEPDRVAAEITSRYAHVGDRFALYIPYQPSFDLDEIASSLVTPMA